MKKIFLLQNFSVSSEKYNIKSFIENNHNYEVYYIQQKFNGFLVHNAISSMAIKNGEVKSYNNRFVNENFGQNSLVVPKIDSYTAIENGLNELKINEFKVYDYCLESSLNYKLNKFNLRKECHKHNNFKRIFFLF